MSGAALFVVLVGFGVLTGGTAGLLGVGGGLLIVPFLTLVADVPQHAAEATSLLVILPTSIVASLVLRRRGIGDLGTALRFGVVQRATRKPMFAACAEGASGMPRHATW